MKHIYNITGMTCNNCVAKIKSELLKMPDVISADVSLEYKNATIEMSKHISISELQETISPNKKYVITDDNNIKSILLTGDNAIVAKSVSDELKMDGFFAEALPLQKLEKIKELQAQGEFVAMTGDGVNDAPALAQADIGIAVGSGSDIAAETAGIILVNSNPKDIASLILFGKATYRKMVQNLI